MTYPPIPPNERERLSALVDYDVLDSERELAFDEITSLIAEVCEAPIALVSFVDRDRQWFKSAVGLCESETPRDVSFCAHALLTPDQLMVVPDATVDPRFSDNALVTGDPNIRFYAGIPLVSSDGFGLGTLCVIDNRARTLSSREEGALRIGGRAIMMLLEQRRTIARLKTVTAAQGRVEVALRAEIEHRLRIEAKLSFSSSHDDLTQLPNRADFVVQLQEALQRLHGPGARRFAVFFIDLDHFKRVNDSLGHFMGDELLIEVGRRLRTVIREGDVVGRFGGDEYTMLIDGAADEETATSTGSRIADVLATRLRLGDAEVSVTASIGICLVDKEYTTVEQILCDADTAMYVSKDNGRNRFTIFTPLLRSRLAGVNEMHVRRRRRHAREPATFQSN